ncbi:hypothetical protein UUU_03780 [Klebsiella pneumoniae subsp. pneumoniae DSM 30104 = JCM 1662 = NBRC 14940]|nr:hypothetical protein UUU_03780 [Klebsiella pneumoniae subsp. pneumoniae DSM 30104 = JCM 1662 = NBRC 14940]
MSFFTKKMQHSLLFQNNDRVAEKIYFSRFVIYRKTIT